MLLVFLLYYLFLNCISPYFNLMWICFHFNLVVVVVDYYALALHLMFLRNLFLKLEGSCMKFFMCFSEVGWICKVDASNVAALHHSNSA